MLLSTKLFDYFIEILSDLGRAYFSREELDRLEEIKLIDIGVLAHLCTLPSLVSPDTLPTADYLHILDPTIEKYSVFLTTILLRIVSNRKRYFAVDESVVTNFDQYLAVDEVMKICAREHLLSHEDFQRLCRDAFPKAMEIGQVSSTHQPILAIESSMTTTGDEPDRNSFVARDPQLSIAGDTHRASLGRNVHAGRSTDAFDRYAAKRLDLKGSSEAQESLADCYQQNTDKYAPDSVIQRTVILGIFECLLHFNHRSHLNGQLKQYLRAFKPMTIYRAQSVIATEVTIVTLLLKLRTQLRSLTIEDLDRYLSSHPIACRL